MSGGFGTPPSVGSTVTYEAPAYGANVTPSSGRNVVTRVGALTGSIAIGAPASPQNGDSLTVILAQDGTGGRTVTWNAAFQVSRVLNNAASAVTVYRFTYDGTSSKWQGDFYSAFAVDADVTARAGAATQVKLGAVGPSSEAGIAFGSASDVKFYRESSSIIRTPGSLTVDANFKVGNFNLLVSNTSTYTNVPILCPEVADPAAPAANHGTLYFRDNGSGKTQICARFPTGAVQVIATEP